MPRTVTVDLTDEQAELLDSLAAGEGIEAGALLVYAVGRGLAVMLEEIEYSAPPDGMEEQKPLQTSRPSGGWGPKTLPDDDLPY